MLKIKPKKCTTMKSKVSKSVFKDGLSLMWGSVYMNIGRVRLYRNSLPVHLQESLKSKVSWSKGFIHMEA